MSFGSPTPVNIAVQGPALEDDFTFAQKIQAELKKLTFLRDLQFAQAMDYPTAHADIDRDRAGQFGLTMSNIAQSYVAATGSTRFTSPELLARSEIRQCVSDSGAVSAKSDADRSQDVKSIPLMQPGQSQPYLSDIATITTPEDGRRDGSLQRAAGDCAHR